MLPKGTTAPLGLNWAAAGESGLATGLAVGVAGVAAGEAATAPLGLTWAAAGESGLATGPSPTPGRVIEVALALAPEAKWRFS